MINIHNVSSHLIDLNSIDPSEEISISNSIIGEINFTGCVFLKRVCICNCLIDKLKIYSS